MVNWPHALRALYWRVCRPTTLGSRCLVRRGESVLLVRHTYDRWWYLPGGGVHRSESFLEAAQREVLEETGTAVHDLILFGLYHSRSEGKSDHIALFVGQLHGEPRICSGEIRDLCFAPITRLPEDVSPATRRRVAEYLTGVPDRRW